MTPYRQILVMMVMTLITTSCQSLPTASPEVERLEKQVNTPGAFSWPDGFRETGVLSPDQCVAVALWNSPDYQAALTDLHIDRSEIIKAGQIPNPALSVLFPSDAKAFEAAVKLPIDAFWLRPKRLKAAESDLESTAARLTQAGADLACAVRQAAGRVFLAQEQAGLAAESAEVFEELSRISRSRETAGQEGGLELAQARADFAVATQEKERLHYEEKLALEKLRRLMGMGFEGGSLRLNAPHTRLPTSPGIKEAIAESIKSRADVRAAELAVIAAGQRAGLARAEVFTLTANAKFTDGAGTQPGFDLALPVFNQNQAATVRADAQLDKAMYILAAARHRAATDTREAVIRLNQAKAVVSGWQKVLPELEVALRKANQAVVEGEAQPNLALDAARRLADSRSKFAESRCRLIEAAAELRRALGKS